MPVSTPHFGLDALRCGNRALVAELLDEYILRPLGMKDTYFFPPKDKWHRMPTAYIYRDGKPVK